MTRKDIESLYEHYNNDDLEYIVSIIDNKNLKDNIKALMQKEPESDELIDLLYDGFHDIISKVKEAGLYDEFEKVGLTDENKDVFITMINKEKLTKEQVDKYLPYASSSDKIGLIIATGDTEYIKQHVNDEDIFVYDKIKLIKATGDIEYIKEQVSNPEFKYEALELVKAIRDKEYLKQYISENGAELTFDMIIELINSVGDTNFILECVMDKSLNLNSSVKLELLKNLDPSIVKELIKDTKIDIKAYEKIELIKSIGDSDFIKECIDSELGFSQDEKFELIKATNDAEYIKQCIEDEQYNWSSSKKRILILSTNDKDYIKQCILDKNIGLGNMDIISALETLGDSEYIKEVMQNEELDWNTFEKQELIKATGDREYLKKCLSDENMKLDQYTKMQLILSTEDIDFIKECVQDKNIKLEKVYIKNIIVATSDSNYIKECLENDDFDFDIKMKKDLLIATKDTQYIKEYLKDNSKIAFSDEDKIDIINSCKDAEFVREVITDDEITISNSDKARLIKGTGNEQFIKECIENKEFNLDTENILDLVGAVSDKEYIERLIIENTLDMQGKDKVELVKCLADGEYIKRCIDEKRLNLSEFEESALITELQNKEEIIKKYFKTSEKNKRSIKLPEGMTIGVEIEADGYSLQKELFDGWKSKRDGSIPDGLEVVSPVLTGTEEDMDNIYTACNMLNKLNCQADEKCGGHVHIGASFLSDKEAYKNLLEIWGNTEKILYAISNKPGEITRYGGIIQYATPISKKIEAALENGSINLDSETELESFTSQLQTVQETRYSGINFLNLSNKNKETIEFRLANGTIDPDTWIENINLFGGIVAASEKLYQIQQIEESERTEEERTYLQAFEDLRSGEKDDKEKLQLLLELAMDKEDRDIYRERYNINSEMMKNDTKTKEAIDEKITVKPVVLKDKKSEVLSSGIRATEDVVTTSSIEEQDRNIASIERSRQHQDEINCLVDLM